CPRSNRSTLANQASPSMRTATLTAWSTTWSNGSWTAGETCSHPASAWPARLAIPWPRAGSSSCAPLLRHQVAQVGDDLGVRGEVGREDGEQVRGSPSGEQRRGERV